MSQLLEGDPHRTDELAMMFTLAQPRPLEASRVALVLRVLCGFGIDEIASALLVSTASIEKRIQRGRVLLGDSLGPASLEGTEIEGTLEAVQTAIYLLFNEGYHSASPSQVVREDLCREAMRLSLLLAEHPTMSRPSSLALAALLFLHAARLPGRRDEHGGLLPFADQDRSRWDKGPHWSAAFVEHSILDQGWNFGRVPFLRLVPPMLSPSPLAHPESLRLSRQGRAGSYGRHWLRA